MASREESLPKHTPELNHLHLSDEQRTGHLPKLVDDIVIRLAKSNLPTKDSDAVASPAAVEHGKRRRTQGYSPAMLIQESRILQVTIFGTLHENLSLVDFSLLLPDVMTIADEVDSQLMQIMESFTIAAARIGEGAPCETGASPAEDMLLRTAKSMLFATRRGAMPED